MVALNQLGQLYSRNDNHDQALEVYLTLNTIDSTNSYYFKQVGNIYSRLENKYEAREWFENALKLNPDDVETAYDLGNSPAGI